MVKLTIITGTQVCGTVEVNVNENGEKTSYTLPVGVELTVSEAVAQAAVREYACQVGYYVGSEDAVGTLPTEGIADGSYCFVMNTGRVLFLSAGAWR